MPALNPQFAYLASAELTDIGWHRKNNEDAMISLPQSGVFCVADGMGGVQGGEVASKAVVDALKKAFPEVPDAGGAGTAEASAVLFERALNEASHWIKARADGLGIQGAGTTVVGLMFDGTTPERGLVMHAGDSRAYRLRGDRLVQLTTDHSVAAAAGLADDSTLPLIFRGVITRAVGLDGDVHLDVTPFNVMAEDVFLLCSDGLDKMLSDRRIQEILCRHRANSPGRTAKCLVDEALQAGGDDNVTVIVIRVAGELPATPEAGRGLAPGGWLSLLRSLFPLLKRRIL
jgi:serine/threonine protein phosphatase PrpC